MFLQLTDKQTGLAIGIRSGRIDNMKAAADGKGTVLVLVPQSPAAAGHGNHSPQQCVTEAIDTIIAKINSAT